MDTVRGMLSDTAWPFATNARLPVLLVVETAALRNRPRQILRTSTPQPKAVTRDVPNTALKLFCAVSALMSTVQNAQTPRALGSGGALTADASPDDTHTPSSESLP